MGKAVSGGLGRGRKAGGAKTWKIIFILKNLYFKIIVRNESKLGGFKERLAI